MINNFLLPLNLQNQFYFIGFLFLITIAQKCKTNLFKNPAIIYLEQYKSQHKMSF